MISTDDKKADASTCRCINCQSTYEESAKKTEKDNEQTQKKVHEEKKILRAYQER